MRPLIPKCIITIEAKNSPGVLNRILSIFSSRGINLESVAVGRKLEQIDLSLITLGFYGSNQIYEQLIRQLYTLKEVNSISNLSASYCLRTEIMFIKVLTNSYKISEIADIAKIYHAIILDIAKNSFTIEVKGDEDTFTSILEVLGKYGIVTTARSGEIAIIKGSTYELIPTAPRNLMDPDEYLDMDLDENLPFG
jgi:acetolactate synthase I/III small subunit